MARKEVKPTLKPGQKLSDLSPVIVANPAPMSNGSLVGLIKDLTMDGAGYYT